MRFKELFDDVLGKDGYERLNETYENQLEKVKEALYNIQQMVGHIGTTEARIARRKRGEELMKKKSELEKKIASRKRKP